MNNPALEIRSLTIRDPAGTHLVREVSLTIETGGLFVLIGETGSGKSLIAQAVLGLLPAGFEVDGTIALNGRQPIEAADGARLQEHWGEDVLLLPQEPRAALDPTMRIIRQVEETARSGAAAPLAALQSVDLTQAVARRYPFQISSGMAQRVLVATALVGGSPLIVADEPTKGLDRKRIEQTCSLLLLLVGLGRSLFLITHDIALTRGLGGRIGILKNGRLVETGATGNVFSRPQHPYTRLWIGADPAHWPPCPRNEAKRETVLAARGLSFAYPRGRFLFKNLDLQIQRGSVLALTGPSGCGKTTLGNILLGLLPPSGGQVTWQGLDPYRHRKGVPRLRHKYQKLHQDPMSVFLPHQPLGNQFAALKEIRPAAAIERSLPRLLDRLKLSPQLLTRYPSEVSGGEAQRLALARILLLEPDLIVADEPTSRLDPLVQKHTIRLLRDLVDEGRVGLLLIGHDPNLLRAVAENILDLGAGGRRSEPIAPSPNCGKERAVRELPKGEPRGPAPRTGPGLP